MKVDDLQHDIMAEQEALAARWLVAGVRQLRARGGLGHRATTRTANRIRDGEREVDCHMRCATIKDN
jgi:hypothetical protein